MSLTITLLSSRDLYTEHPVHGVMIGREAYRNPWLFAQADRLFYNDNSYVIGTRREVIETYLEYAEDMQSKDIYGSHTCNIVKPLHNAFSDSGSDHNTAYKRKLDDVLKRLSGRVDKEGTMTVSELIHTAMEDTIPASYLDEQVVS